MSAPPRPPSRPAPSRLTPEERARFRRVVRIVLRTVITVQVFALVLLSVPEARSWGAVAVVKSVLQPGIAAINTRLATANGHLQAIRTSNDRIEDNTDRTKELAEQHSKKYGGGAWDPALAAVTSTPTGELDPQLSFATADAAANLSVLVPGAVPWKNYHQEYAASADAAILTLRSSLTALNKHYEQIEDDSRLQELASQAHSADSYLAMDELQVQSSLEVARQLHALRAQQALSTNLYAVAESHRIGSEARTKSQDSKLNCSVLAVSVGGSVGVLLEAVFC